MLLGIEPGVAGPARENFDGSCGRERGEDDRALHGIVWRESGIGHLDASEVLGRSGFVPAGIGVADGVGDGPGYDGFG